MKQYSIIISKRFEQALRILSEEMGVSKAETIRRAIALLKVAMDEQRCGRRIITESYDGKSKTELLLK